MSRRAKEAVLPALPGILARIKTLRPRRVALVAAAVLVVGGAVTLWSVAGSAARDDWTAPIGRSFTRVSQRLGLTVDEILVVGRVETSRQSLLQAIGTGFGEPILAVDLRAARGRVLALPWVSAAELERVLPNTLIIRLHERQPAALWQRRGHFTLIDRDGRALAEGQAGSGGLIVLVGDDAPPHAGRLLDMLTAQPELRPLVRAAVRVGGRRWNLHLDNDISVRLPEADPEGALQRLVEYQRGQGLLDKDIATIDMRFADKLILKPREPQPEAKPDGGKPGDGKPAKGNNA